MASVEGMSDATFGLILQVTLTVIASVICHWLTEKYLVASAVAALIANVMFQIADYMHQEYLNKFALVGFIFGSFYSFAVALVVGIPFWIMRKRRKQTPEPVGKKDDG